MTYYIVNVSNLLDRRIQPKLMRGKIQLCLSTNQSWYVTKSVVNCVMNNDIPFTVYIKIHIVTLSVTQFSFLANKSFVCFEFKPGSQPSETCTIPLLPLVVKVYMYLPQTVIHAAHCLTHNRFMISLCQHTCNCHVLHPLLFVIFESGVS